MNLSAGCVFFESIFETSFAIVIGVSFNLLSLNSLILLRTSVGVSGLCGRPVFPIEILINFSGLSATILSPIKPPQSCPKNVRFLRLFLINH